MQRRQQVNIEVWAKLREFAQEHLQVDVKPGDLALLAGACYGALMGVARMAQGGHFPSDVLWAGGVVYLVGLSLYYLLRLDLGESPEEKEPCEP